jgi:hypothetical protein
VGSWGAPEESLIWMPGCPRRSRLGGPDVALNVWVAQQQEGAPELRVR